VSDETEATRREGHASSKSVKIKKAEPARVELSRGTLVGRYVLLDKIGEGGMGVVYGAFDPELDRKVAIKVLQGKEAGGSSGGDQAWLLREAQALARLAHPNVVAVHDVGTLPGDQVFVAMELVEGMTMRHWLRDKARPWRDVVPVMLAAGQGLAAAHGVGLVHRDFKPENVLVGKDGRVRVMDFGLARLRPSDDDRDTPPPRSPGSSPLSAELTIAGHVVGTPAYMAPEIYEEHPADARTDQFAFGVALFEALFHARPYEREDLLPNRSAPPRPKIPPDMRVPARLQRVALRAIAIDPAQRFASMQDLLAELAVDPTARRRRALVASGAVLAVGGAIAASVALASSGPQACRGLDKRLAGVWDPATRRTVHDAFIATKLPYASQAYASLEQVLDKYAEGWLATAVESCEATHVRGDQTADVFALRQGCLDQRLEELAALVHVLSDPGKTLVEKGGKAGAELEPVSRCSNLTALREPIRPPPELEPKLRELTKKLADAKAQMIAGNYVSVGAIAMQTSRMAEEIGYPAGVSDAEFLRATTLMVVQSWDEAAKAFRGATWSGMQARRDDIVAHGALSIAEIDVQGLGKATEAKIWLELAQAAGKRLGTVDSKLEARTYEVEGIVAAGTGDLATAIAAHEKALALGERIHGHDSPLLWEEEEIYGASLTNAFEYAKAVPHYERAIELRSRVVGPEHGDIALVLSNLAICYRHLGDPKARATFDRALALREKLYGKNSPILVPTLDNYGDYLRQQGDLAGALADMERAVKLSTVFPGKDHPTYQQVATDYAETLTAAQRFGEARALYDETLASEARTSSAVVSRTLMSRSELALAEHAWKDAESYAQRAVASFEAAGGKENPELWRPLTDLARARIELARPAAETKPLLERALAIGEHIKLAPFELAATRDALARVGK
jgi:tetratricopeptide (TPR) repeat protein